MSSSDESCVSLAVLPVDIQIGTLRQRYDDVYVALVACDQQPYLRQKKVTGEELKDKAEEERFKFRISKNVQGAKNLPEEDEAKLQ